MSDKWFLDTNIFIYAFSDDDKKRDISDTIIANALESGRGLISFQVIQEFSNAALRKFANSFKPGELKEYCSATLYPLCQFFPSFEWTNKALDIYQKNKIGYYDSLIVAAALLAKCRYLITEDLNDGQKISGVTILNPYKHHKRLQEIIGIN